MENQEMQLQVFHIEWIDSNSGETHRKRVEGHALARQVARSLAMASGRRVIVRRAGADANKWRVYLFDMRDGQAFEAATGVSQKRAAELFRNWDAREKQAVCVMWPAWAPPPIISI